MLPNGWIEAKYKQSEIEQYRGNPLIECLPPLKSIKVVRDNLKTDLKFQMSEIYLDSHIRIHAIAQLIDNFFQPLSRHIELESKISMMIRQGYVGRNLSDGRLNSHLQNGYERIMTGKLAAYRFEHIESTAKSFALIGCSGSGKTVSINMILATYPQVIHHEKYNTTQIVFLKIDCPFDGSLKSLCHNFFRAIDKVLHENYSDRYLKKRHSVETLIALMAQVANLHAIGMLVIDEIQHLSARKSGGAEAMLNFFVTLVNTISIPVMMVGTPKARPIFELDLRSARRASGFGSVLWEPLPKPLFNEQLDTSEWGRFTNQLWKRQWLKKANPTLSSEISETWFDLSQGIIDIVIKLYVLSQIRAVVTGIERITPKLMRKVYEDELKPIHPMIDALRSGIADRIAKYSDLTIPYIDKRVLELTKVVQEEIERYSAEPSFGDNSKAIRLHRMLVEMGYDSNLLAPLVGKVFQENPTVGLKDLIPIIIEWYSAVEQNNQKDSGKSVKMIPEKDWHTLDSDDLRFVFSQADDSDELMDLLEKQGLIFKVEEWIDSYG